MLNNQPMGFYHPATLVKDAQGTACVCCRSISRNRTGVYGRPRSRNLRLGFRYVRGLREEAGRPLSRRARSNSFSNIDDLLRRVPDCERMKFVCWPVWER